MYKEAFTLAHWPRHLSHCTCVACVCLSSLWAIRWAETGLSLFCAPHNNNTQCLVTGVHGGLRVSRWQGKKGQRVKQAAPFRIYGWHQ